VTDAGCLRQSGGARCVDQQRAIIDGDVASFGWRKLASIHSLKCRVEVGFATGLVAATAVDPDFRLPGQIRHRGLKNRPEIIGDDDVNGIGDVDAVGQRQPDQFGIDECRDAANPGDTEPGGDVIRPARHQQANGIAGFNPRR